MDLSVPINLTNNGQPPNTIPNQSSGDFVGSNVDPSVPINLADLDGVVYPTIIDFPDCLSIDINFNKSVIHSNSINNSNDTIEASSSFDMNIDTSFPVISTINNNNHSRYNYTLPHSKLICTGPFWRLPKYSLPPPIQLGPEHLASYPLSVESIFDIHIDSTR